MARVNRLQGRCWRRLRLAARPMAEAVVERYPRKCGGPPIGGLYDFDLGRNADGSVRSSPMTWSGSKGTCPDHWRPLPVRVPQVSAARPRRCSPMSRLAGPDRGLERGIR